MGEDVFYSGTVAAAMEGLVAGIPSIAVSYAGGDLDVLEMHKDGLRSLLKRIVEVKDFPKETLLNINLPALPGDQVKIGRASCRERVEGWVAAGALIDTEC